MRPAPAPPDPFLSYARPDTPDARQIDPAQDLRNEPIYNGALRPTVEHSVWDEPGLSRELAQPADDEQLTYARWLADGIRRWTAPRSWAMTLLIALAAGPWAIVGAFMNGQQSLFGGLMLVFFAPVTEELMKIGAVLVALEKAPFIFRSGAQIVLCAVAGGLAFAAIENLIYLHIYVPNPPGELVVWRWTVCVGLHTGCSLVAGLGALRVWRAVRASQAFPRLTLAFPFLVAAAALHGLYNALAWAMEALGALPW